jgi:hypothetical protein
MREVPDYDADLNRRFMAAARALLGRKNLVGGLDHQATLYLRKGEPLKLVEALERAAADQDAAG